MELKGYDDWKTTDREGERYSERYEQMHDLICEMNPQELYEELDRRSMLDGVIETLAMAMAEE